MKKILTRLFLILSINGSAQTNINNNYDWQNEIWAKIQLINTDSLCYYGDFEDSTFAGWTMINLCRKAYSSNQPPSSNTSFTTGSCSLTCGTPAVIGCAPLITPIPSAGSTQGYGHVQKLNYAGDISCLNGIVIPKVKTGLVSAQIGGDTKNSNNAIVDGIAMKYVLSSNNLNVSFDVALRMADFTFHQNWGAAYFWAAIVDSVGNVIDKINIDGSSNLFADPFVLSTNAGPSNSCFCSSTYDTSTKVFYRPWKNQTLSAPSSKIGTQVALIISVGDCAHCGHSIVGFIDNVCLSDSLPPVMSVDTAVCNQSTISINHNYSIPPDADLSKASFLCRIYKNGSMVCTKIFTPTTYTGNHQFQFTSADCPNVLGGCFDYNIFLLQKNIYGNDVPMESLSAIDYWWNESGPNNTHVGMTAGKDNDVCCTTTSECTSTCQVSLTLFLPNGGGNVQCMPNVPIALVCNTAYSFATLLNCNPTNSAIAFRQVKIYDAASNTPAWAIGFTGTGSLNIPASVSGTFYLKYIWGTTTTNCDSLVYTINITCPPPCPNCTLSVKFYQNGSWITCSTTAPTTVDCGQTLDIDKQISCTPNTITNSNVQAYFQNSSGSTPAWVNVPQINNNILSIPENISGTYYLKYVWSNANGRCDSTIYPINIICSCQSNCSFTGQIWGTGMPATGLVLHCRDTINVQCNSIYQGGISLNCSAPASNTLLTTGKITDAAGQVVTGLPFSNYNFTAPGLYTYTYYKTDPATGIKCDSCKIIFNVACPCSSACTLQAIVTKPAGGGNITLSTINANLECGKGYDFNPATLTCNPINVAMLIKQVKVVDVLGNIPAWASAFSGTGILSIPSGTTGLFYVKYVWGTATTSCDSVSYPVNITCCNLVITGITICNAADANTNGVNITVTGGAPPYSYAWNNGSGGQNLTNVPTGTYWVQVTDASGCTKTDTFRIICPAPPCNCSNIPPTKKYYTIDNGTWIYNPTSTAMYAECNKFYNFWSSIVSLQANCSNITIDAELREGTSLIASQINVSAGNTLQYTFTATGAHAYIIVFDIKLNGVSCKKDSLTVQTNCAAPPNCDCKKARCKFKTYYLNPDPTGTKKQFKCNENLKLECNKTYPFIMDVNCQANCPYSVTAELIDIATGLPVQSQTNVSPSNPFNVTFTVPGINNYIITYHILVNGIECDKCTVNIKVECPPPVCASCNATVSNTTKASLIANSSLHVTQLTQLFTFTGLPTSITEIRAVVTDIIISATDDAGNNKECLSCISNPIAWGSIIKGSHIAGATATINVGGTDQHTPIALQIDQNPRQIAWAGNGNVFNVNNPLEITFYLPPASALSCCTRKANICVKFVFRDNNCQECIVRKCFDVEIK